MLGRAVTAIWRIACYLQQRHGIYIKAVGCDAAIVGIIEGPDYPRAIYDSDKLLQIYQERDGMTYGEAVEFFDYNVRGFDSPGYPLFLPGEWER